MKHPDNPATLVTLAHQQNRKVFLSLGGWNFGDGGGNADPTQDIFNSVFYNGVQTIKAKTQLAVMRNCAGVMRWEISQDVKGEHSLTRAINEAIPEKTSAN